MQQAEKQAGEKAEAKIDKFLDEIILIFIVNKIDAKKTGGHSKLFNNHNASLLFITQRHFLIVIRFIVL
ncbi:MAG: hypothetical protein V4612_04060 [Pseudomonadota bacterium]